MSLLLFDVPYPGGRHYTNNDVVGWPLPPVQRYSGFFALTNAEGVIFGSAGQQCLVRCYEFASGKLARQFTSAPDGSYRIEGLIPGAKYDLRYGHIAGKNDVVHTGIVAGVDVP